MHTIFKNISGKLRFIIIAEAIFLSAAVLLLVFTPLASYNYPYTDLVSTVGEKRPDLGALYINGSMNDMPGFFGTSPASRLAPGTYSVELSYNASEEGSTFHIVGQNTAEGIVLGNYSTPLPASQHDVSLKVWILQPVSDFTAKATFSGSGSLSVYSIRIQETYSGRCLIFSALLFFLLLVDVPVFCKGTLLWIRKNRNKILIFTVTVLFASYPLFNDYLFETSDMRFHLRRIYGIKTAILNDHQFPVRILTNCMQGYGYPVSIFYGDLFLYFPAFLCTIGMPLQTAYKIYIICIHISTVLLSYFYFSKVFKNEKIGLAAAFLYTLSPYRISILYIRAALGEFTAMTFLPLVFYGLWKIYMDTDQQPQQKNNWLPLALGLSGIIQCHILSCEMTGIFIVLVCLILWKHTFSIPRFYDLCKAAIATLCLNAWFLIPFITYMVTGKYAVNNPDAAYLPNGTVQASGLTGSSLLSPIPFHRVDASGITLNSYLYVLGLPFLLVIIVFCILYINRHFDTLPLGRKLSRLFGFLCFLSIWLCSCYFPYSLLQKLGHIPSMMIWNLQFPYRFLTIFSLLATILFCLSFRFLLDFKKDFGYIFCCLILLLSLFQHGNMMEGFISSSPKFQCWNTENADMPRMGRNDYLPIDTDWTELSAQRKEPVSSPNIAISFYKQSGTSVALTCENTGTEEYIEIPLLYYTGYSLDSGSDSDVVSLVPGTNHKIRILFHAPYSGKITVRFSEPWYWRLSEIITLLSLLYILQSAWRQKSLAHYQGHAV